MTTTARLAEIRQDVARVLGSSAPWRMRIAWLAGYFGAPMAEGTMTPELEQALSSQRAEIREAAERFAAETRRG